MSADNGSASPAGFNIPIPVDLEGVIRAWKEAIKSVSADLDALRKKAEAQVKGGRPLDPALANQIEALGAARRSMQQTLAEKKADLDFQKEAQAALKVAEARESSQARLNSARLSLVQAGMQRIGMSSSSVGSAMGFLQNTASAASGLGRMASAAGYARLGTLITGAAGALGAVGGPVGVALLAAEAVAKASEMYTGSISAVGKAAGAQAQAFERLAGGRGNLNTLDPGNAQQAQRVNAMQTKAFAQGQAQMPLGVLDAIANILGFPSANQIAMGERYRSHEEKMEAYRQKLGVSFNANNKGTRRQANIIYERRMATTEMKLAGMQATAQGQGERFYAQQWELASQEAEEAYGQTQVENRERILEMRAKDPRYAINRVLENEQRRWLRDVETDRVMRYNAWSMA